MVVAGAKHKYALNVFHSWGELITFADTEGGKYAKESRETNYGDEWVGTASWEECRELALNGWPEGEEIVSALSASILGKVTDLIEREHVVYDVEGIGLDVATYLNGEPECWQKFESEITQGQGTKHLRIVYNCSVSGGVSVDVIRARGAALATLIQALEYAGNRVELWALPICCGGFNAAGKPDLETRVLVKAADQDLDMSRVSFALAHPSMLRRIGFSTLEAHEQASKDLWGYGSPSVTDDKGDLYIDSATLGEAQWNNPLEATKWVIKKLKEQGVIINEK